MIWEVKRSDIDWMKKGKIWKEMKLRNEQKRVKIQCEPMVTKISSFQL
jgi:hypothetical protein